MSTIVNLYGGPGVGKSTSAAYIYALFKQNGYNAELVRECIKPWAWEGRKITLYDQLYFLGKQIRLESMLYNKVDYIVTDCPVWMIAYYTEKYGTETFKQAVTQMTKAYYTQARADDHLHYHIALSRSKSYNSTGRYQTEEEAIKVDEELKLFMDTNIYKTWPCQTSQEALYDVYEGIRKK